MEAKDDVKADSSCCAACGYVSETHGRRDKYQGGLKVKEIFINDGDWFLGSEFVFKDRQLRPTCTEPATHAFLKRATSIPIPTIRMSWEEEGERFRTIEERIHGETLDKVWKDLSEEDRHDIAQQTADYLKQLRVLTSNRIEGVNGAPLYSAFLFGQLSLPSGPFDTKEGFWEALAEKLKKRGVSTKEINELGKDMPPLEPYTFTSAGVSASCVVVKDKKVVGITEWGTTGFLPFWYEFAINSIAEPGVDYEWKLVLGEKLQAKEYEAGLIWFDRFLSLGRQGGNKSDVLKNSKNEAESLQRNLAKAAI